MHVDIGKRGHTEEAKTGGKYFSVENCMAWTLPVSFERLWETYVYASVSSTIMLGK